PPATPARSTLSLTTLFRSRPTDARAMTDYAPFELRKSFEDFDRAAIDLHAVVRELQVTRGAVEHHNAEALLELADPTAHGRCAQDRKSTRLNSSHVAISYA